MDFHSSLEIGQGHGMGVKSFMTYRTSTSNNRVYLLVKREIRHVGGTACPELGCWIPADLTCIHNTNPKKFVEVLMEGIICGTEK